MIALKRAAAVLQTCSNQRMDAECGHCETGVEVFLGDVIADGRLCRKAYWDSTLPGQLAEGGDRVLWPVGADGRPRIGNRALGLTRVEESRSKEVANASQGPGIRTDAVRILGASPVRRGAPNGFAACRRAR